MAKPSLPQDQLQEAGSDHIPWDPETFKGEQWARGTQAFQVVMEIVTPYALWETCRFYAGLVGPKNRVPKNKKIKQELGV